MTDKGREAFEAWVGKGLHLEQIPTGAPFAGDYRSIVMQTRWDAWQAATAIERERCAKLCESITPCDVCVDELYEALHKIRSGG